MASLRFWRCLFVINSWKNLAPKGDSLFWICEGGGCTHTLSAPPSDSCAGRRVGAQSWLGAHSWEAYSWGAGGWWAEDCWTEYGACWVI